MLPYDVRRSQMITMNNNRLILVGGYTHEYYRILNTLLELEDVASKWKETRLPLKELRSGHIAFKGTRKKMNTFCGKN